MHATPSCQLLNEIHVPLYGFWLRISTIEARMRVKRLQFVVMCYWKHHSINYYTSSLTQLQIIENSQFTIKTTRQYMYLLYVQYTCTFRQVVVSPEQSTTGTLSSVHSRVSSTSSLVGPSYEVPPSHSSSSWTPP